MALARLGSLDAVPHLEHALALFDALELHDDPLYLECAIFMTLTLIRPHDVRPRYATIGAGGMLTLVEADLHTVTGGRPSCTPPPPLAPKPDEAELTGAEVRVAVAVADGLSNKGAAERLFVSVKTVEFHLGNTFRKLDVRTRTELARRRDTL